MRMSAEKLKLNGLSGPADARLSIFISFWTNNKPPTAYFPLFTASCKTTFELITKNNALFQLGKNKVVLKCRTNTYLTGIVATTLQWGEG